MPGHCDIDFDDARCCMSMPEVEQIKPIDEFMPGAAAPPGVAASAVAWAGVRSRVVAYFVVGLLALDLAVVAQRDRWMTYSPDGYLERVEACRQAAPDLVLVGSSTVSEGIDPSALAGLRWRGQVLHRPYNLGLPGGTTSEAWHAVKHGLRTPPRLLVYGLTASDWNDARQEPHGPGVLMTFGDLMTWVRTRPDSAEWVTRHFVQGRLASLWSLFYYRDGIRLWTAATADGLWPGVFPNAAQEARENVERAAHLRRGDGFAPRAGFQRGRLDGLKASGALPTSFPFLEHYRITGGHLAYLERLLDWAQAEGVDVVLVDMPVSADLEERMYPEAFALYRRALGEIAQRRRLPLLSAHRGDLGLSDRDFGDLVHLNASGVPRMSQWLGRMLEAGA